MKVLVCGGRRYGAWGTLHRVLDELHAATPIARILHGACPSGADLFAEQWGYLRGVPRARFPADWEAGRAAGPQRNQRMLDEGRPDLVVAFPGGPGTADMVRRAERAGVRILRVGLDGATAEVQP